MKRFLSVLLAVLMVFSSAVSYAAPSIAGVADSLFEAPSYEEPAADETSSLSAEVASVTSEYGALVVKFTFDDIDTSALTDGDWTTDAQTVGNTASATNRLSDVGGIWGSGDFMATTDTNRAFIFDEIKATTVKVVEETDGNKYLQLTGTGSAGYFGIGDYNGGGFVQSVANGYGGHIIFTADVLSSSNTKPFTQVRFNRAGAATNEGYFRIHENIDQDATLGEWSTVVVSFDDTNDTVNGKQEAYTSAWNATTNRAMLYHALAEGEIAGIDNLTMWLVPNEVEVTIDNGSYADNETVTIGGGIKTAAEIKAAITTAPEGYFLKGIKTSEDGELLADDDTVIFNGIDDVTIYAVWCEINYIKQYEFTSNYSGVSGARLTLSQDSTVSDGVLKAVSTTVTSSSQNAYLRAAASVDASTIEDIRIRFMFASIDGQTAYDNSSITMDSNNLITVTNTDGTTASAVALNGVTYTATSGEWIELSYKELYGDLPTYFASKSVASFESLHISFASDLPLDGDTLYVDYIRFIGEPLPRVYVDAANDTFSDYDYYYDAETTVADVLEQLTADDITPFFGKTLKTSDGTILETSDLISEVAEDEDTLTVVYGKYNDFGFDFDTASANGDVNGGTLAARFDATVVDDEDNAGNTLTEFTAATSLSTDSVRVGLRSDRGRMYINNLGIDAGKLEKILIKMRFTEIPEDGEMYITADGSTYSSSASTYKSATTTHNTFYFTNTGDSAAYAGIGSSNPYTMPEENVYVIETISGDTNCGISSGVTTSGIKLSSFDFDQFRYDFPAAPEGFTVQVDEVLFLSNDTLTQYEINNEGVTETYYFDTATAVSEILADFASADDTLAARALRYGDTILSGDDTLESIPEYAELQVLYSTNIYSSLEFTDGVSISFGASSSSQTPDSTGAATIGSATTTHYTDADGEYARVTVTDTKSSSGAYNLKSNITGLAIPAGVLKDLRYRLRFDNTGFTAGTVKTPKFYYGYTSEGNTAHNVDMSYTITDGEWIDVSFAACQATALANMYTNGLSGIRLDFGFTLPVGATVDIDYFRFIGDAQPVVILDMGDLADDIYISYTSSTTVADLVEAAGFESDAVSLDGVTYSGVTYGAADTIESILGGDDAVVNIAYSNKKTLELDLGTIGLDLDGKVSFTNAGYYDGTTTVGDIIDSIVISDYAGLYELKGLSADASRTVLDENVTFADLAVNDKVALTAIWRKMNVIHSYEFDGTEGTSTIFVSTTRIPYVIADGVATATANGDYNGNAYFGFNNLSIPVSDVYDVVYRMRTTKGTWKPTIYVYSSVGSDGTVYTDKTQDITYTNGSDWEIMSYRNLIGNPADKITGATLTAFRIQGTVTNGTVTEYDYMRILGHPLTEIVVDLSELGLSDLVSGYDDETTVSDILSEIVYDGDKSLDALVYGGKQYTGDTTIKSILNGAEGTFTVKAVSPKYVTVMDGETALLSDVAVTGTMTLADVVAKLDTTDLGTKKLLGLAAAADATEALDSDTLAGNACTYTDNGTKSLGTLYVVYEEYTVLEIVSTDFETEADLSDVTKRVGGTTSHSAATVTHGIDEDGTTYAKFTFTSTNDSYPVAYDTGFTLNTITSTVVPAGALDGILIRMRLNGTPTEATTYTYYDDKNSTEKQHEYNPAAIDKYLYWGSTTLMGGIEKSTYDYSGYEVGEWFTVYLDASEQVATMQSGSSYKGTKMNAYDLGYLRYDFNKAMPSGSSIDIDYIKLVGDPGQLPNTTIYRIDMTTNNDKASDVTIPSKYTTLEEDATAIVIEPGETLTLSDFTSQIYDEGELDFVGFNTDKDATTALDATTVGAVNGGEAITLYAIWNEYDYNTLYSLDFETNSGWGMGAADTDGDGVYKTDLSTLGGHGSVYQANYNADNTITAKDSGFITHNAEEGYITAHFDVSDDAKTAIDANTDETHTSSGYAVSDARITIATVDNEAYIPAGTISKVIIRARINDIEDYTESQNYWFKTYRPSNTTVGWGNFNPESISLPQLYVTYDSTTNAGGTNGKLYNHTLKAVTNAYIRNGEWFTYEFDASEFGADVNDIHWMRFDFNDTMPDGTSIDIDFIRFVGTDMAAPETHEDRTSVRFGTNTEDARNGIRVIASLNPGIYDADATDIGWMFSSSKRWYAAGYTMDELTMDKDDDTSLIVPGYVRQNGVKMAEFFDDTADTEWFFSAVLYNIPIKNYKSPFIVRPFVKIYGAYAYGEAFETNFLDFADAAYDSCSDEQKAYIDTCRESYDTYLAQQEISGDIETNFTDLLAEPTSLLSATIIPTNDTAPVVSGNYVTLTAWKDGAITTVDVYTTGTYPAIMNDDGSLSEYYADKPCVIAQVPDIDGEIYYLKSLANSGSADGVIGDINLNSHHTDWGKDVDATSMFVSQVDEMASPFQRFDRYYQSDSSNCVPVNKDSFFLGDFELGTYSHTLTAWSGSKKTYENAGKTAYMTDDTTFVVKYVWPDGTSEWATYDAAALNATGVDGKTTLNQNIEFSNLTYVVSDNLTNTDGESSATMEAEDLVLLAGVVDVPEYVTSVGDGLDASMYGRIRIKLAADKLPSSFYEVNKSLSSSSNVAYTFNLKFTKNGTTTYTSYSVTDTHFGLLADGSYVLDFDMTLVPEWQGTITDVEIYGTCTYKKNWYSSSTTATMDLFDEATYVRYLKTSDKSINDDLSSYSKAEVFEDGNFVNGIDAGTMESSFSIITGDEKFLTTDSTADASWKFFPGYTYDYTDAKAALTGWDLSLSHAERFSLIQTAYDNDNTSVPFYTDYEMKQVTTTDGTAMFKDDAESKVVEYRPGETITYADGTTTTGDVLSLGLNCTKIFNGEDYYKYNPSKETSGDWYYWPHLLIDQPQSSSLDGKLSCDADRFYAEFDIRLASYSAEYVEGELGESDKMSFLLYSYIVPKDLPEQKIWFGLNLAGDESSTPPSAINWCRDSGANTHMYCLSSEMVYGGVENSMWAQINNGATSTDWIHVKVDLTAHVQQAIDWVNSEDAFGIGVTTLSDWCFNGVNIGFECQDNVDCTFELANFNFYAYNPQ